MNHRTQIFLAFMYALALIANFSGACIHHGFKYALKETLGFAIFFPAVFSLCYYIIPDFK